MIAYWYIKCYLYLAIVSFWGWTGGDALNWFDKKHVPLKKISLQVYSSTIDNYKVIRLDELKHNVPKEFKTRSTIVFYFPGFTERPSTHQKQVDIMTEGLLIRPDILPVVLNYEYYLRDPFENNTQFIGLIENFYIYKKVVRSVVPIADNIAQVLIGLVKAGKLDLSKTRMIGKSLGGQIVGRVGLIFKRDAKLIVPRITGLDPAGPLYYEQAHRLSKEDAAFVDIIHTNYGGLGFLFPTGNADFYANFPFKNQPGCRDNPVASLCSHDKSVEYFVESIRNPKAFPTCKLDLGYFLGFCKMFPTEFYMGYDLDSGASGVYAVPINTLTVT